MEDLNEMDGKATDTGDRERRAREAASGEQRFNRQVENSRSARQKSCINQSFSTDKSRESRQSGIHPQTQHFHVRNNINRPGQTFCLPAEQPSATCQLPRSQSDKYHASPAKPPGMG